MDSRANSKTFLMMGNFFKTQVLKRYRPFNFGNLLISRLWIDINLSKTYPKRLGAFKGVPIKVTGG